MLKKIQWYLILCFAFIATIIFFSGFLTSISITTFSNKTANGPVDEAPSKVSELDPNSYNILVMGDSLAKGTGDERGKGFDGYFKDSWKSKTTKPININNIAINGDVSSGLLKVVQSQQNLNYIQRSEIIFISIGGNEISRLKSQTLTTANSSIKNLQDNYLKNLNEIFKTIRSKNSSSLIIFMGLYNPFGKEISTDMVSFLNDWNYQTEQLVSVDKNSIFIPTYDLFKYNLESYLTVDNFHPNSNGYQAMANRILEALKNYKQ